MDTSKPCGTSITSTTHSSVAESVESNLKHMNLNFADISNTSSQTKNSEAMPILLDVDAEQQNRMESTKIMIPQDVKKEPVSKEKYLSEMGYNSLDVVKWEEIVQPEKKNLYDLMNFMITNHMRPNVEIRIGSKTFNCQLLLLQCYSDFFMECSANEPIQLPEEKVSPSAFMMAYNWMLDDTPLIERECIIELFSAASFLRSKQLIDQCWSCFDDDVYFREDNAFILYLEARMYNLPVLEELMLTRVCKFFLTLVSSTEFLELEKTEVCRLLNLNSIGVNSEVEIFMSVVRWLDHDWENRQTDMLAVVNCVRFNLMPACFLMTLKKPNDCVEINRIIAHPEVKKMINRGIYCISIHTEFGNNLEELTNFLALYELTSPLERAWVYDKGCTYHHRPDCRTMQHISYSTFQQYLGRIQSGGKNYWHNLELAKDNEKCTQCIERSGGTDPIISKFVHFKL